jgi:hypothetical protein
MPFAPSALEIALVALPVPPIRIARLKRGTRRRMNEPKGVRAFVSVNLQSSQPA